MVISALHRRPMGMVCYTIPHLHRRPIVISALYRRPIVAYLQAAVLCGHITVCPARWMPLTQPKDSYIGLMEKKGDECLPLSGPVWEQSPLPD